MHNGVVGPAAFITVEGQITLTGDSTTVYQANNTGSGKYDFLVFAPTMDLSPYAGGGRYEFHIFADMKDLNGSGEESFISGVFRAPRQPEPVIPEPSSMMLMGLGLTGIAFRRLKKFFSF